MSNGCTHLDSICLCTFTIWQEKQDKNTHPSAPSTEFSHSGTSFYFCSTTKSRNDFSFQRSGTIHSQNWTRKICLFFLLQWTRLRKLLYSPEHQFQAHSRHLCWTLLLSILFQDTLFTSSEKELETNSHCRIHATRTRAQLYLLDQLSRTN